MIAFNSLASPSDSLDAKKLRKCKLAFCIVSETFGCPLSPPSLHPVNFFQDIQELCFIHAGSDMFKWESESVSRGRNYFPAFEMNVLWRAMFYVNVKGERIECEQEMFWSLYEEWSESQRTCALYVSSVIHSSFVHKYFADLNTFFIQNFKHNSDFYWSYKLFTFSTTATLNVFAVLNAV